MESCWILIFSNPQLEPFYSEDEAVSDVGLAEEEDVRQGRMAELQVIVAETQRGRGVGTFLVKTVLPKVTIQYDDAS